MTLSVGQKAARKNLFHVKNVVFALFLALSLFAKTSAQETRKVRLACDAGLFKKHGLEPELIQMAGPLPIAALAAGEIDYLTGYTTGIIATGQGAPLKGIMVSLRKPPFYLVAEPSIQKPGDLTGKRTGVDRIGSLQQLVARLLLKIKGVDGEKVLFTQTGSVSNTVTSSARARFRPPWYRAHTT
jgi:ABC-type nitrate/sulfonate/bicarbonate transport system substrate-binding protein